MVTNFNDLRRISAANSCMHWSDLTHFKDFFRTQSNIYDVAFLVKKFNNFQPLTIFANKLHPRSSTES